MSKLFDVNPKFQMLRLAEISTIIYPILLWGHLSKLDYTTEMPILHKQKTIEQTKNLGSKGKQHHRLQVNNRSWMEELYL